MANIPPADAVIKPREIVIHHPFVGVPITEPFCPVALAEYVDWGWRQALNCAGDALHLIHPHAPYRRA